MKLATALSERADIQTRIEQLSQRLMINAKVQEGDMPAEDPEALMKELSVLISRLEELVALINLTNSKTMCDGLTLTALLSRRDALTKKIGIYRNFLNESSSRVNRFTKSEIRIQSTVDVTSVQQEVDAMSKYLRLLDEKIQGLNWTTDLIKV